MTKQVIIEHISEVINQLPDSEAVKIAEFADLLLETENKLVATRNKLELLRKDMMAQLNKLETIATYPISN